MLIHQGTSYTPYLVFGINTETWYIANILIMTGEIKGSALMTEHALLSNQFHNIRRDLRGRKYRKRN